MLKIWGRRNSINVQKVMWAVAELGIDHERIDAGGPFGGLDTEDYGELNPNRRVPTIDDGGVVVWESHAIVRYLASKHGAGSLWPDDTGTRVRSDMWMEWTTADLQPARVGGVFWNFYRTPEPQRNWTAIRQGIARSATLFRMLDHHLDGKDFVAGDRFTIGDIATGVQLYRYYELEIDRPNMPNVEAWYTRLKARPAYREHVMVPFDELKGRLAF